MKQDVKALFLNSFDVVTRSAHPDTVLPTSLPNPPSGMTYVIGAGKAAGAMAAAFERSYRGDIRGIVVTRYGHSVPTQHITVREAAHPVPDAAGQAAVGEIIDLLAKAGPDDLIICLLSGGGSALLSAPVQGVTFAEIQALTNDLLKCGASITEINTVRKHLNIALGGGLAKAAGQTKIITLAISDVTGDDPTTIASGPTVADPTTLDQARDILTRYDLSPARSILDALANADNETPKPDSPLFQDHEYRLIATGPKSLNAAAQFWTQQGFDTHILDPEITGDTNDAATRHVQQILTMLADSSAKPARRPLAILSGGETTVKVTGDGQGGPNAQFMLQACVALNGHAGIYAMACDTDGIDGSADSAGAIITPQTLARAAQSGLDAQSYLARNDRYGFFDALGDLVKTGPSHTNVNDYRVFLIFPEATAPSAPMAS
ncbi:MAG TPA: glycerate kinase [Rhodospirillaceae bacterium]|nr:glycerate kinase [Rhodospirillaceae bacterium]